MTRSDLARAVYEINRAYRACIGEPSRPAWDDASEAIKQRIYAGVDEAIANPNRRPEKSHERWLALMQEQGYVYGEAEDASTDPPTHPCMRPYHELSSEQRVKDHLFMVTVRVLAPLLGE